MKLSVLANLYGAKPLDEALSILAGLGVHTVEIGAGGYPGKAHCNPEQLLADEAAYNAFIDTFKKYNTEVCALACHGNPVHPNQEIALGYDRDFRNAILLAEKMGVDTVIGFSGCPGDHENALYPNWVTCPWPEDFLAILDWQWNEKLIPYWCEMAKFAFDHKVTHIAFEMHPGFCVYNPETLLKLRRAVSEKMGAEIGAVLGANFDPSHLIWQGMDPVAAIRELTGCIYHVHAKDTKIDKYNTAKNGVLDTKHYSDELNRAWVFRAVGFGNNESYWRDVISNLRLCGYDGAISIEHEDSIMTVDEGLRKAISVLAPIVMTEDKPRTISWA